MDALLLPAVFPFVLPGTMIGLCGWDDSPQLPEEHAETSVAVALRLSALAEMPAYGRRTLVETVERGRTAHLRLERAAAPGPDSTGHARAPRRIRRPPGQEREA